MDSEHKFSSSGRRYKLPPTLKFLRTWVSGEAKLTHIRELSYQEINEYAEKVKQWILKEYEKIN